MHKPNRGPPPARRRYTLLCLLNYSTQDTVAVSRCCCPISPLHPSRLLLFLSPSSPSRRFLAGPPGACIPAGLILIVLSLIYPLKVPAVPPPPYRVSSQLPTHPTVLSRSQRAVTPVHALVLARRHLSAQSQTTCTEDQACLTLSTHSHQTAPSAPMRCDGPVSSDKPDKLSLQECQGRQGKARRASRKHWAPHYVKRTSGHCSSSVRPSDPSSSL